MLASVPKDLFGGGMRAGISIQPVGFLVVQNGDVRLLQMTEGNGDTANNLIRTLPEVISKVSGLVKSKKKPNKSSDDATTDEEA
ncbi:MAG: GerW family sporulation protein [Ruminococcus sp.]